MSADARSAVLDAARERAAALVSADAARLEDLLHPEFRWTAHTGRHLDRAAYVEGNTGGATTWLSQDLGDPEVVVVDTTAVLRTTVTDTVERGDGPEVFVMPLTQVWVLGPTGWRCLAGHAGPRLTT